MSGNLYDPINVFCKIAAVSVHEPRTRIDLTGHTLTIQPPSTTQSLGRSWPFTMTPPSRDDMYRLLYPLRRVLELVCSGVEVYSYTTGRSLSRSVVPDTGALSTPHVRTKCDDHPSRTPRGKKDKLRKEHKSPSLDDDPRTSDDTEDDVINAHCAPPPTTAPADTMVSSSPAQSAQVLFNHLYRNRHIHKLLRFYLAGLESLQQTYGEGNSESTLQLAINIASEAFELATHNKDLQPVFSKFPPSFNNYPRCLLDQSQIIELWRDSTIEKVSHEFESYMLNPLPQNVHRCKTEISKLLDDKDQQYLQLIKNGTRSG